MIRTLTQFLVFASLILVSCKQAKERREDLGPEYSGDQISDALLKATDKADISKIAVGQNVQYSHTRRIENAETVINMGARIVEAIERTDEDSATKIALMISEATRQNDGKFATKVTEDEYLIAKPGAMSFGMALAQDVRTMATGAAGKITFHHLKESDAVVDPPLEVKQRGDCGGLKPSSMRVHYVQFEMVVWQDDKNYQKISFDFGFSLESPYLPYGNDFELFNGVLINDCRSTYVPIESRTVYVRDCFNLEDFKK
jgi:hypothetical protein